jgi:hypothetical protein
MLGLDGFVLLAVSQQVGEFEQAVETTTAEDFCRGCGVQARLHDRRPTYVRDLPAAGRPDEPLIRWFADLIPNQGRGAVIVGSSRSGH